jgi:hypothetical protein
MFVGVVIVLALKDAPRLRLGRVSGAVALFATL